MLYYCYHEIMCFERNFKRRRMENMWFYSEGHIGVQIVFILIKKERERENRLASCIRVFETEWKKNDISCGRNWFIEILYLFFSIEWDNRHAYTQKTLVCKDPVMHAIFLRIQACHIYLYKPMFLHLFFTHTQPNTALTHMFHYVCITTSCV